MFCVCVHVFSYFNVYCVYIHFSIFTVIINYTDFRISRAECLALLNITSSIYDYDDYHQKYWFCFL